MKTYKVSELEGALLDAAVFAAEGFKPLVRSSTYRTTEDGWGRSVPCTPYTITRTEWFSPTQYPDAMTNDRLVGFPIPYRYSTDWCYGGGIIEAHDVRWLHCADVGTYCAWADDHAHGQHGKTMLQAAMRAVVFAKFGDTVELPC